MAPIGYNPKGVGDGFTFDLNIQGYSEARGREFQRRLLDKVRAIPASNRRRLSTGCPSP